MLALRCLLSCETRRLIAAPGPRSDSAAPMPILNSSSDCSALRVRTLKRVPAVVRKSSVLVRSAFNASLAWTPGHFPYPDCGATGPSSVGMLASPAIHVQSARLPVTVLMVTDHKYMMRIAPWAAEVNELGLSCAVGDVSAVSTKAAHESSPCLEAASTGCECFRPPTRARSIAHRWDLNGVMALAVRWRFLYAKQLLQRGRSVLMHDADVFFRPGGLAAVMRWLNSTWKSSAMDFAVQDNGRRSESYDDLNWGFVWMSGSHNSIRLIGCTLDAWTHKAFAAPKDNPHSSYHARSQPRINHVLEAAMAAAGSPSDVPHTCLFPSTLLSRAMRHLSGYENAEQKLMCARSEGVLDDPSRGLQGRLLYGVPVNASVVDQKRALSAALTLGEVLQHGVTIPPAVFALRRVPFCHLFDANTLPMTRMTRGVPTAMRRKLCAAGMSDAAELAKQLQSEDAAPMQASQRRRLSRVSSSQLAARCVSFDSLVRYHATTSSTFRHFRKLRTCDPMAKSVTSLHACHPRAPHADAPAKVVGAAHGKRGAEGKARKRQHLGLVSGRLGTRRDSLHSKARNA